MFHMFPERWTTEATQHSTNTLRIIVNYFYYWRVKKNYFLSITLRLDNLKEKTKEFAYKTVFFHGSCFF